MECANAVSHPEDSPKLTSVALRSLGGFAATPISTPSRTSTPTPARPAASAEADSSAVPASPTRATAAQGLEKEVASVMAGFGSFWGRVKKQVRFAAHLKVYLRARTRWWRCSTPTCFVGASSRGTACKLPAIQD